MGPKNTIKMTYIYIYIYSELLFGPPQSYLIHMSSSVHFSSIRSTLVSFGPHWPYSIHFIPIWSILIHFSPIRSILYTWVLFDTLRSYLVQIVPIQSNTSTLVLICLLRSPSILFSVNSSTMFYSVHLVPIQSYSVHLVHFGPFWWTYI